MKNTVCAVCGKEFPPKANKMFCSDACRQKAYQNKKGKGLTGNEEEKPQKDIKEKKEVSVKFTIDFKEYEQYIKYLKDNNFEKLAKQFDFVLFAFFRKNLMGIFKSDMFHMYFNEILRNTDFDLLLILKEPKDFDIDETSCEFLLKTYMEFIELYHAGGVLVKNVCN